MLKNKFRFSELFKKKINKNETEGKIMSYKRLRRDVIKKRQKERKKKLKALHRKNQAKLYLEKAGVIISSKKLVKYLFNIAIALNLLLSIYFMYYFSTNAGFTVAYVFVIMIFLWIFIFVIILFVLWLLLYLTLDLKVFKRTKGIEEVFPDFLQLTASNINAGMTIDKALWYAVRPSFGVLAKEIEDVAKRTMSGERLDAALRSFAAKYDSDTINRSVDLIIEGIEGGGAVGDLLNRIALDIRDSQILRKEMAAGVMTYVIFITFSSIIAAPFLIALAGQILEIIKNIISGITLPETTTTISFALTEVSLSSTDFRIFATISLMTTAFFSAMIVATIKKGDVRGGIKYIPIFMVTSMIVYYLASYILDLFLGGLF